MTINWREFNKTAERLLETSSRTYPEFLNGQGLALALRAIASTVKADAERLVDVMGRVGTRVVRDRKTGKFKKGRDIYDDSDTFAARIINKRRRDEGKPLLFGEELTQKVTRMVGARKRAVAFIRSGWVYPVRALSRVVYGKKDKIPSGETASMRGKEKGYAKPAERRFNDFVVCEIANSALIRLNLRTKQFSNPMPIAQEGLARAAAISIKDMEEELARRMKKIWNAE